MGLILGGAERMITSVGMEIDPAALATDCAVELPV